jgi:ABC-type bacteriocin/lantibiotic exporter with double-glycine peptidase domain
LESATARARWVIGQAALACQAPARPSHESGDEPLSPLARLIGLLQPEKKDLWVIVVFSLVVGVLALATPVAVEALVNSVAFGRYLQPVIILAVMLLTFLTFAAAMRGLITYIVEIFQRRLFIRVVEDLAYRLPRVRQQEFDRLHGPELVNRFFDVVTVQKVAASLMLDGISIVLQTAIGMAVLAFYHPFLLGFDIVLLLLIGFVVFALGRGAVTTAIKESKAKYAVGAWLEELARHTTAFKLYSGSQFALDRADQLAFHWLEARRHHFHVVIRQILFALGLQAVAATALLGLGGWLVILGELTLGQLVAAELIVMMIVGSFAKLGKHMESFYDLLASVDKLGALFDLGIESHDKLFHLREGVPAAVRLREVSYAYGDKVVLDGVSLEIAPGQSVALVGGPGSGKSTTIDLLCGLRAPSSGHIELDGIDLREIRPDSLREHLAAARGIEIFRGTIDENVHLNRPNVRANDVRDALEAVGLLDEILRLPDGLNAVLQTGGAPLTATQAMRLMLARAIVDRPRLLLIDGALDGLPDNVLRDILPRLTGNHAAWTLLVATGQRDVIAACDWAVSLDASDAGTRSERNTARDATSLGPPIVKRRDQDAWSRPT